MKTFFVIILFKFQDHHFTSTSSSLKQKYVNTPAPNKIFYTSHINLNTDISLLEVLENFYQTPPVSRDALIRETLQ